MSDIAIDDIVLESGPCQGKLTKKSINNDMSKDADSPLFTDPGISPTVETSNKIE